MKEDLKLKKVLDYDFMKIRQYQYKNFSIDVTVLENEGSRIDVYDKWKEITMKTTVQNGRMRMKIDFMSSDKERIESFNERYKEAIEVYNMLNEHRGYFFE
mgnify:CR=1 FL=1